MALDQYRAGDAERGGGVGEAPGNVEAAFDLRITRAPGSVDQILCQCAGGEVSERSRSTAASRGIARTCRTAVPSIVFEAPSASTRFMQIASSSAHRGHCIQAASGAIKQQ